MRMRSLRIGHIEKPQLRIAVRIICRSHTSARSSRGRTQVKPQCAVSPSTEKPRYFKGKSDAPEGTILELFSAISWQPCHRWTRGAIPRECRATFLRIAEELSRSCSY